MKLVPTYRNGHNLMQQHMWISCFYEIMESINYFSFCGRNKRSASIACCRKSDVRNECVSRCYNCLIWKTIGKNNFIFFSQFNKERLKCWIKVLNANKMWMKLKQKQAKNRVMISLNNIHFAPFEIAWTYRFYIDPVISPTSCISHQNCLYLTIRLRLRERKLWCVCVFGNI